MYTTGHSSRGIPILPLRQVKHWSRTFSALAIPLIAALFLVAAGGAVQAQGAKGCKSEFDVKLDEKQAWSVLKSMRQLMPRFEAGWETQLSDFGIGKDKSCPRPSAIMQVFRDGCSIMVAVSVESPRMQEMNRSLLGGPDQIKEGIALGLLKREQKSGVAAFLQFNGPRGPVRSFDLAKGVLTAFVHVEGGFAPACGEVARIYKGFDFAAFARLADSIKPLPAK